MGMVDCFMLMANWHMMEIGQKVDLMVRANLTQTTCLMEEGLLTKKI